MLYFNVNNNDKEKIINLLQDVPKNNNKLVESILNEHRYNFASIKKFNDDSLEIINGNDYILLGPLGGIYETKGKYDKYNCFERDLDEFDLVLQKDVNNILSGNADVINLG